MGAARAVWQVWASSPAAEQLVWTDPDKADYSSRYDDESDADEDNTVFAYSLTQLLKCAVLAGAESMGSCQ